MTATVALVIASMFLIDVAATNWARSLPSTIENAFERITYFGLSGWFLIPFSVVILLLAAIAAAAVPRITQLTIAALAGRFAYMFVAIAVPGLFTTIIKRLIGRARPYLDLPGDPFTYRPFGWRPDYASMPSGHATTSAAAAFAIGAIWPRSRVPMWIFALIIMLSRVVVLAHHPSDVIAGALVGTAGAALVRRWFAARRLTFSPRDLRCYRGPSLRRIRSAIRTAFMAHAGCGRAVDRTAIEEAHKPL